MPLWDRPLGHFEARPLEKSESRHSSELGDGSSLSAAPFLGLSFPWHKTVVMILVITCATNCDNDASVYHYHEVDFSSATSVPGSVG